MIPLDNGILVVESCDDIVIGFNGDPYRGVLRSGGGHFGYKSAKCWTLENVSFPSPPPPTDPQSTSREGIKNARWVGFVRRLHNCTDPLYRPVPKAVITTVGILACLPFSESWPNTMASERDVLPPFPAVPKAAHFLPRIG